jgi:hypothetical protein
MPAGESFMWESGYCECDRTDPSGDARKENPIHLRGWSGMGPVFLTAMEGYTTIGIGNGKILIHMTFPDRITLYEALRNCTPDPV